jgi:hypothetical protein
MLILEVLLCALLLLIGCRASVTDCRNGCISNNEMLPFYIAGMLADIVYYVFFATSFFIDFAVNVGIVLAFQLILYSLHAYAGGDLKFGLLITILYPGRFYLDYNASKATLILAFGFAILYGYVYFLLSTIWRLGKGEIKPEKGYFIRYLKIYLLSYLRASIYVVGLSLIIAGVNRYLYIPDEIVLILGLLIAWSSRRYVFLQNKWLVLIILGMDIALSIYWSVIPFSLYPETYLVVAILLACQMIMNLGIYEKVDASKIKAGMILSAASSLEMQFSAVTGLPGVSGETLKDRLTDEQAESVQRWAAGKNGKQEISIVRKIPFAVFIFSGFITYMILWGLTYA